MGYDKLVGQNPLRILDIGSAKNGLNMVMARAGIGKTALLVQIALDAIMRGKRVLHVSVGESIDKTKVWYDDILEEMLKTTAVANPHELVDMVNRHRMIMTFKENDFNRSRFEERLNDLVMQDIFKPDCIIVDGLDFASIDRSEVEDMNNMVKDMGLQVWFSAVSHRDDERVSPLGVPAPCHEIDELLETVVVLTPESDSTIGLNVALSRDEAVVGSDLKLDPATMMVKAG